MDAFTAQHEI